MKLNFIIRFFVTLGILSMVPHLRAQEESSPTNAPAQIVPTGGHGAPYVNRLGIGVQIIDPFGFSAKYFFTDCIAVDGAAGWVPGDHNTGEIHADILFHDFEPLREISHTMPIYYGAGLLGRFRDENHGNLAGFRFPVGVSYMYDNTVDVFGEVAPELFFAPFTRGGISVGIGIRFWF